MSDEPREYVVAVADKMRRDFNVFTEEALRDAATRDPENYRYDEASRSLIWIDRRPDFMVPDAEVIGDRFVVNRMMDADVFFKRYIAPQIPTEEPEP